MNLTPAVLDRLYERQCAENFSRAFEFLINNGVDATTAERVAREACAKIDAGNAERIRQLKAEQ